MEIGGREKSTKDLLVLFLGSTQYKYSTAGCSPYVVGSMVFREVTVLEESQLGELKIQVRVGKLNNSKDEVNGEMVKFGCDIMMDWIWRLCNMDLESDIVPEIWRSGAVVPLYKG